MILSGLFRSSFQHSRGLKQCRRVGAVTAESPSQFPEKFPSRDGRLFVDKVESSDGDPKFTFNNVETGLRGPCNYGPVVKALRRSGNQGDYKRCNYAENFHKLWRLGFFFFFFLGLDGTCRHVRGFEAAQTGEQEGKYTQKHTYTHTLRLWTNSGAALAALLSTPCWISFLYLRPRECFLLL